MDLAEEDKAALAVPPEIEEQRLAWKKIKDMIAQRNQN